MYRFLLTPRWLALALGVLLLGGAAVQLGSWQFDRRDERRATNLTTESNLVADPVPVGSLLAGREAVGPGVEWRVVTATGTYDPRAELFVRNQTREAGPGVSLVVPLRTTGGEVLLVERGWVSTAGASTALPEVDPPPAGEVTVTGWLRRDSDAGPEATEPVDGTVRAIDSDRIASSLGTDLLPGYVALTEQDPPVDEQLQPPVPPDLGQGPHFFYGLQWWFFALLAAAGYVWFAWSEAHPRRRPRPTAVATGPHEQPAQPERTGS